MKEVFWDFAFEVPYQSTDEGDIGEEAIDPESGFYLDQTEQLVTQYLGQLDYNKNLFLSTPEGMLEHFESEDDFRGKPYVFDIEVDRRARVEPKGGHPH